MVEEKKQPKVVVLGGAVMDLVFPVRDLPLWTQAVQAHAFRMYPGGKGLNQAIAASRLGANTTLISVIGDDEFGERISSYLEMHRITCDFIKVTQNGFTDVTAVFVNQEGSVSFVGWKGISITDLNTKDVNSAKQHIEAADVLLLTFEVSLDVIEDAISIARSANTRVILNPAPPLDPLDPPPYTLLRQIDVFVPNVWEARQFLRNEEEPKELASALHTMGAGIVCVTNAEHGCVVATKGKVVEYKSFLVGKPVDTTGGSDAFCASLAISLIKGEEIEDAVIIANAAAALSVMKRGGSPSMPRSDDLNRFLHQQGIKTKIENEVSQS